MDVMWHVHVACACCMRMCMCMCMCMWHAHVHVHVACAFARMLVMLPVQARVYPMKRKKGTIEDLALLISHTHAVRRADACHTGEDGRISTSKL